MLKIVSPTGCVHAVDRLYSDMDVGNATLCNHANYHKSYGEQYYHKWPLTGKDVICKRCLYIMNKKIEYKENDWTKANRGCEHRYPHLKYGVVCRNKCYLGTKDIMRKCHKLYCAIPYKPTSAAMVSDLVCNTIINISKDLLLADKSFKLRFDMIAVHCGWKKPSKSDYSQCTNPDLKDLHFGWACGMKNCPYMNDALNWRCNHGM